MTSLTCPKCHGAMRQYERNGVTVDQCTDCRGIFLDRGELERLVDAESRWAQQHTAPPPPRPDRDSRDSRESRESREYRDDDSRRSGRRKRKHWIEELFD